MLTIDVDYNDYSYFAYVVEFGGFSAAARHIGIPKSRLSRRIAALEERLGVRLLQRSTRKLTLTDVGQKFLNHCQALQREAEAAECIVASVKAEPSGRVRLSVPPGLLDHLTPVLQRFITEHPKVILETITTTRRVDLLEEGIDVALRVRATDDEDPQWATRRLRATRGMLVASPALVARLGGLSTPGALALAPALGTVAADQMIHWRLVNAAGEVREFVLPPRLVSEHFGLRRQAAIDGLGVTMLPMENARADIEAGLLVEVLPEWRFPLSHLQAVYASQRGLSPAVRALLDLLVETMV
ncbi:MULTISPECIES: LysR substrate-binding domain-containing protein [Deefgea]|uniref:LysR family transcriptional regulator n=1 Tax=Deefgea chitinilytica TaxID=570276 RepID=A0ABS2CGY3_9NEIS|nr:MULTISPECIES: LysR substrate-binding domain-containing protein [Deefgea]MBM5572646.1 LysR family transcriptional regulator [Deefgea chitinilytica]MBM9889882.1 LysR family transcriptional regulator [Deefgea sp. CFH1-16]